MLLLGDSLSWTTFGIAVGGAGFAALLLLVLVLVLLRRRSTHELEGMLRESTTRVEAMLSDLSGALDHAREETARSAQLGEIGSTIDLDEVLARTLEAAGGLVGVDGAMVVLDRADRSGSPLVATVGLSAEEAAAQPGPGAPDLVRARAALTSYLYDERVATGEPIRGCIAVPVRNEAEDPIGTLRVFWRTGHGLAQEEIAPLEELAGRAGPAIENARRFQEARQLADLDALTGLHNYRYFHETLAREVARAHRYGRRLALVVFDIDDFKAVNDRIGHLAGDSVLAEAAQRVRSVVRGADIACRIGGDEFAVVLPESTTADAENLYRRLESAMSNWRSGSELLRLSAGIAELEPNDDVTSFFKRADDALYRAKERGKGQAAAAAAGA